ncbi:MAG: type IV pilus twitching motility protein PilT [Campylobacterales bacterium]|nr:type IV pilus twitching motility protein PilT [Campylobacterales bacterium]
MNETSLDIHKLLKSVVAYKASDLHLVSRSEPQIRIDGRLVALNLPVLDGRMIEEMAYSLLTEKQKKTFEEHNELDFSIVIPEVGRFRANYYKTMEDIACAFRIIPIAIPSLDDLNAKKIFKEIIKREKGLILVTGPTGSGKSTTLAAMLNEINMNEARHIITVEDPVEFVHTNKKALFSHRNIGTDTSSFATALKYAMREDPDVILIGEMRDKETITAALTAAETGHLVFGTLHTNSAPQTINRIIDVFAGDEQPQVRAQLSTSLVAVISQALLPKIGGGRIAAQEIMITNPAIANLIREDKVHQLYSQMQLNQQGTSMTTQTQEIVEFLRKKLVSKETALQFSNKPDELLRIISTM